MPWLEEAPDILLSLGKCNHLENSNFILTQ